MSDEERAKTNPFSKSLKESAKHFPKVPLPKYQ